MLTKAVVNMDTIARPKRPSRLAALAEYFRQRPNQWVSALSLLEIGGTLSWRSRLSELRDPPFGLHIINRQRVVRRDDGSCVLVSEYRSEVEIEVRRRDVEETTSPSRLF